MLNKKEPKVEVEAEAEVDERQWVCADCRNPIATPRPVSCPRCGSTAANPV